MEKLTVILLFLLLVIGPIGSYMYLKKGFNYRIQALGELKVKSVSKEIQSLVNTVRVPHMSQLICIPDSQYLDVQMRDMLKIDKEIVTREFFQVVCLFDSTSISGKTNLNFKTLNRANVEWPSYILVDSSGSVRNTYKYSTETNILPVIIKHLSVVIPMPTKRELSLKR